MAELAENLLVTQIPSVYGYSYIGTAASTTTLESYPAFLHTLTIVQGVASGKVIIYDSIGTSTSVLGSVALGTQLVSDLTKTYTFDVRTKTGLTIENSANVGIVVSFGK